MKRLTYWLLTVLVCTLCGAALARDQDDDRVGGLRISTVSTRPDTVSGGNVLVRIDDRSNRPMSGIHVELNHLDVSALFQLQADGSLLGLVSGLQLGRNELTADATRRRNGNGRAHDELVLTNYPITGPIFSGPHETPFVCMTAQFTLPASTQTLGPPLDTDCSIATRVDYVYRSTDGTYKPLPSNAGHPADLATTTTTAGKHVSYIVRVETGTINRAIYQTAILHDPVVDPAPTPFAPPPSWNGRLVYTLGGGCVGGYYIQGRSIGNGGILEDLFLRQGFGVASSSLNVYGNNCQQVLAAETMSMVRERFIENFGPAFYTMGFGCSGGSEQAQPISDEYPSLVDGILVGCSFPELTAGITLDITDADLFNHYLTTNTTLTWAPAAVLAATGYPTTTTPLSIGPGNAVRTKAQGGSCNAGIPVAQRFDQVTNPHGVRCDIYDHMVNIWGRDPTTGYARRPLDNVGVQYGLGALNTGAINVQQFLDLNANIGGYDNNGNYVATRTVGDLHAIRVAYETGQILYGGRGMKETPIIDYRGYVDQPENGNEVHARFHSFSVRERLLEANGNFDNQVMLIEDGVSAGSVGLFNDASLVLSHAVTQMDQWLTGILDDDSNRTPVQKMRRAKPADLVDACFTNGGATKIAELQVYQGNTRCNQLYPAFSTPRMVAGEPLANNVLKCQLKRVDVRDYNVRLTNAQENRLKAIFPDGVCDYRRPGVEQQPTEDVFAFF